MRKAIPERQNSNSYECSKGKKSQSLFRNKGKNATPMLESVKKQKITSNSKSNKKSINLLSNKSLKALGETNRNFVLQKVSSKAGKENEAKKFTVNIKSLKQKALGINLNNIKSQTPILKNYQPLKRIPKMLETSSKTDQSLLDFSCVLNTPQTIALSMFEVGRRLGKGRFGDVFMAREKATGFALALKVLNKKEIREANMQAQLLQEIKIQTYANHPNVLKMYGCFADSIKIYLLLQLATSGCLFKQIRSKEYLQQNQASFHLRQVVNGVRYLHSLSVIHRDIKPQNILISFDVLKLCDFGWAIYSPLYQRQTFCGTLDYVPPEIVVGDYYDQKVDVWCIGVLCYELCTGKAPFESKVNENETYNKILKVEIAFPKHFSSLLIHLVSALLHRDPKNRITLAQIEMHQWMKKYQHEQGRLIQKDIWDGWLRIVAQK